MAGGRGEFARFFAVAVGGLILDFAAALALAEYAGVPLALAAGIGFFAAAGLNYLLHELWTFQDGARQVSTRRMLRYGLALGLTAAARIAVVAAVEALGVFGEAALPVLVIGAGASFVVNYLASRHLVFTAAPDGAASSSSAADAEGPTR